MSSRLTTAYTQRYRYDKLGNLQQLRHTAANAADSFTRSFDYGNGATNYLQSVQLGADQVTYQYDAAGNVTQENGSRHYQWDAADQLRQFATWTGASAAPTLLAYYLYSGGQRVKKLTQTSVDTWQVTVYVGGGFEHRYEVRQGTRTGEQTQVAVLDGQHRLYQRCSGDALGDQRPDKLYALDDHLGSTAAHTDATGGLVSREEYYPFGETSFGSTAKQRYRFCGKELDEESGLYYYGMRYYAPWLCRFVSVDPLAPKYDYYTPYQYAGNRPINFIDLDGAEPATPSSGGAAAASQPLVGIHSYNVASYAGVLPATNKSKAVHSLSAGGYTLTPQYNTVGGIDVCMYFVASIQLNNGSTRIDYAVGPGKGLHDFLTNHQVYEGMANFALPNTAAGIKMAAYKAYGKGSFLSALGSMWGESTRDPMWWLDVASSTVISLEGSAASRRGQQRAGTYQDNWQPADLDKVIQDVAPGSQGNVTGGKIYYTNKTSGLSVVYDTGGNYIRIQDPSIQNSTNPNVAKTRYYLDLNSKPIPANKVVNGKQKGITKGEYQQLTHFANTGRIPVVEDWSFYVKAIFASPNKASQQR